jgi:hypothetical protein
MVRRPVKAEVVSQGDERFVVLTYANGEVVKRKVEADLKPTRRPRRPPSHLKMSELRSTKGLDET